jgi:hypothetical protein
MNIDAILKLFRIAFQQPYLHFTLITTGFLLLCVFFLIARLRKVYNQLWRKWHPPTPFDPRLLKYFKNAALWWFFWTLFGGLLVTFALYLCKYQYIGTSVELAGKIRRQGNTIRYANYDHTELTVTVQGGEAAAGGIFLRFPRWMRYLGLQNYHKLITFRGNQENKYHYSKPGPEWLETYADPLYIFIYKHQKGLNLKAFYTESPYFSGITHRLYVTHSGYIIQ